MADDEVEENSQISELEIPDDTDAVAETSDEQTEDSENVVTVDSSGEASENEETDFEKVEANIGTHCKLFTSSSVTLAVSEKRIRAVPLGTVGGRTGRQ